MSELKRSELSPSENSEALSSGKNETRTMTIIIIAILEKNQGGYQSRVYKTRILTKAIGERSAILVPESGLALEVNSDRPSNGSANGRRRNSIHAFGRCWTIERYFDTREKTTNDGRASERSHILENINLDGPKPVGSGDRERDESSEMQKLLDGQTDADEAWKVRRESFLAQFGVCARHNRWTAANSRFSAVYTRESRYSATLGLRRSARRKLRRTGLETRRPYLAENETSTITIILHRYPGGKPRCYRRVIDVGMYKTKILIKAVGERFATI